MHILNSILILIFCSLICLQTSAQVQRPTNSPNNNKNSPTASEKDRDDAPKEKAYVNYFSLAEKENTINFQDTSLNGFEIYAPNRTFENAALNLGNLGSSHQKIVYNSQWNIFSDIGFHQYDLYKLELEKFRFYDLNRAYNDLYFSPQDGQQNFLVKAKFSRNFGDNQNISLDFERIKQEGFYKSQETKMTRFGFGIFKKNKNHELYITFLANNFNELHNGGVSIDINNDPSYQDPIYRNQRTSIPTFIEDGTTRHQQFTYAVDNDFSLKNSPFKIFHRLKYENGYYRYGHDDVNVLEDTIVYHNYITDDRGIRFVNKFNRISNELLGGFDKEVIKLSAGIKYSYLAYNNGLSKNNIHDAAVLGNMAFVLKNISKLTAHAELAVGENAGNFLLKSELMLRPTEGIFLKASLNLSRYDASLIQKQVVVTGQSVFNNDFEKVNELKLGADLRIEALNLDLGFTSGLIDNYIFYDHQALPNQSSNSTEYIQASIQHKLIWKFIGFENAAVYQKFTDNIYRLPKFYSQHNLYLESRLFKKRLLGRVGILFYNIHYDGQLSFLPITGSFYPSEQTIDYYPSSEFYLNFQVDQFRIFFRYDNFTDLLDKKVHYQIVNYPQFDAKFRMGIRWIFSD